MKISKIINLINKFVRAPEVILGCCEWSHASDLWSLGCIIVELYTGKLFFDTHDNYEHVAMIEKAIGFCIIIFLKIKFIFRKYPILDGQ